MAPAKKKDSKTKAVPLKQKAISKSKDRSKVTKGSIEEQVLEIVRTADKLMSVQSIKQALVKLGRKDGGPLKIRFKTVLDQLEKDNREDFVKIRGSYYAGADSKVGKELAEKGAEAKILEDLKNWYQCAWCEGWIKTEDERIMDSCVEAFDARGCSYICPLEGCGRRFWWSFACEPGETMRKYHKGGYHAYMNGKSTMW